MRLTVRRVPVARAPKRLRVPEDALAGIDQARGRQPLRLAPTPHRSRTQQPADHPSADRRPDHPPRRRTMSGTVCSGPGFWQRDIACYGLRHFVLCAACAAALQGHVHQREITEAVARAICRVAV
jgi:hypothetical protein